MHHNIGTLAADISSG